MPSQVASGSLNSVGEGPKAQVHFSDFLRAKLNDPKCQYLNIEGHLCSKRMIAEWACRYLKHFILKETSEASSQTDDEPKAVFTPTVPKTCREVACQVKRRCADVATETKNVTVMEASTETERLEYADIGIETDKLDSVDETDSVVVPSQDAGATSSSTGGGATSLPRPLMQIPPPLMQIQTQTQNTSASVPTAPLLAVPNYYYYPYAQNQGNYYWRGQQQQTFNTTASAVQPDQTPVNSEYERAKNWRPKDEDQDRAMDQAKRDVYNVLVVYKGCALRNLLRNYCRTVQERLELDKLGLRSIRDLLVQMSEKILVKKERYTGEKYIFPNMGADDFETVAHIGELVAEQRDNDPLPNEAMLTCCEIKELYEDTYQARFPQMSVGSTTYRGWGMNHYQNQNPSMYYGWGYPSTNTSSFYGYQYRYPQQNDNQTGINGSWRS